MQRGIAGVVSKRDEMSEVLRGVQSLAGENRYVSTIAGTALRSFSTVLEFRRFTALTRRQLEVTGLMLCGLSVAESARLLHRRMNTVSAQRTEACRRPGFFR